MYNYRRDAPTEEAESYLKTGAVACMGRMGSGNTIHILVPECKAKPTDVPVCAKIRGKGVPYIFYVQEKVMPHRPMMVHWYGHTMKETARDLYHFALPYAEQGRLVASNYDSVCVIEGDEAERYVKRYTAEAVCCDPGTWRYLRLHNVFIKAPRAIFCDEKIVWPGMPKKRRQAA